jgi:peptidase M28-like protein
MFRSKLPTLLPPLAVLVLASTLILGACGSKPAAPPADPAQDPQLEFDQDQVWQDLTYLVETIGRRRIDTAGSMQTRQYIREQLEPLGWEFEDDHFEAAPPEGAGRKSTVQGTNLIARWPGTEEREIWLTSHYDTFDRPKFLGANDGGSSTAVLIELGRQLAGKKSADGSTVDLRMGPGITLVWFDGEEPFYPVRWDDETNSTFGSRHLAAKLQASGEHERIIALVLLDMVGDKNLGLELEKYSTLWLRNHFRKTARKIGYDRYIAGEQEIKDDHRPFLKVGVDCIDLIDFKYPDSSNKYWHTKDDTLDKCSAESMAKVGRLVLAALPGIAAHE